MRSITNMRILFIGDYSNVHTTLARELRKMGHEAHVVYDGGAYLNISSEYTLKREKGVIGGFRYLFDIFNLLPQLKDYDAVQLINTNFLSLKPQKIKYFYDILKKQNGGMYLTLAGNDYYYVKACFEGKLFRFSEFKIGNEFTKAANENPAHMYGWLSRANRLWAEYLLGDIDGAMSLLPEYDMVGRAILGDKVVFTNLPIDFGELPASEPIPHSPVKIMTGMRSKARDWKGTVVLAKIMEEIEKERPEQVRGELVKDVAFKDFLQKIAEADIVLDQLYAYSPAMTSLYTMGMGRVSVSGAQPEYYEYIDNPADRPIVSISPFDRDIKERILALVDDPEELKRRGEQGRILVENNNSARIVTERFLAHWEKRGPQSKL